MPPRKPKMIYALSVGEEGEQEHTTRWFRTKREAELAYDREIDSDREPDRECWWSSPCLTRVEVPRTLVARTLVWWLNRHAKWGAVVGGETLRELEA